MAYKQNPGRGNQKKTGNGLPAVFDHSPMQQISKELKDKVESVGKENQLRLGVEGVAKNDSIVAYKGRKGTEYQKVMAGNAAANATRTAAGMSDMNVYKGRDTNKNITFSRDKKVEREMPTPVKNPKTGQYGFNPKENLSRSSEGWITTKFTTAD